MHLRLGLRGEPFQPEKPAYCSVQKCRDDLDAAYAK